MAVSLYLSDRDALYQQTEQMQPEVSGSCLQLRKTRLLLDSVQATRFALSVLSVFAASAYPIVAYTKVLEQALEPLNAENLKEALLGRVSPGVEADCVCFYFI